jgi:hypothetical protein
MIVCNCLMMTGRSEDKCSRQPLLQCHADSHISHMDRSVVELCSDIDNI